MIVGNYIHQQVLNELETAHVRVVLALIEYDRITFII